MIKRKQHILFNILINRSYSTTNCRQQNDSNKLNSNFQSLLNHTINQLDPLFEEIQRTQPNVYSVKSGEFSFLPILEKYLGVSGDLEEKKKKLDLFYFKGAMQIASEVEQFHNIRAKKNITLLDLAGFSLLDTLSNTDKEKHTLIMDLLSKQESSSAVRFSCIEKEFVCFSCIPVSEIVDISTFDSIKKEFSLSHMDLSTYSYCLIFYLPKDATALCIYPCLLLDDPRTLLPQQVIPCDVVSSLSFQFTPDRLILNILFYRMVQFFFLEKNLLLFFLLISEFCTRTQFPLHKIQDLCIDLHYFNVLTLQLLDFFFMMQSFYRSNFLVIVHLDKLFYALRFFFFSVKENSSDTVKEYLTSIQYEWLLDEATMREVLELPI